MASLKGTTFTDRLGTQADAKKAMLERFRARPPSDDPEVLARQAERKALADAREARRTEREATRREEEERLAAEKLARDLAELERHEREKAERESREAELAALQKAKRDERYANRKKKKKR